MKVNDIHNVVRSLDPQEILRQRTDKNQTVPVKQNSPDGDRLDISLSAKITNEYGASTVAETDSQTELSAQQISDIRTRIANGDYDRPDVLNDLSLQIRDFYRQ
jgi:hypothetical protein